MEFILAGSLLGAGFLLSSNGKENRQVYNNDSNEINPSENTIYDSNHIDTTRKEEALKAMKRFQKAKNAIDTNIVPPQFNNKIFNTQNNPIKFLQYPDNINTGTISENIDKKYISSLSGNAINIEEFTHNNMSPFFGSKIKQNTYEQGNQPILELYTGTDKFNSEKKEGKPMFKPDKNINNVYGTQISVSQELDRYVPSQKRTNEVPIEKIHVGPGLNKGYISKPSGGFGQNDTRDFIMPRDTDQIRVLSNPKISYKGRVIAGKNITVNPGEVGAIEKNKPDTYSKHGPERYFTTVGSVTKETAKPCLVMKDTNRKVTKSYTGSGAPVRPKPQMKNASQYRKSTKNSCLKNGPRNATLKNRWKEGNVADYGKKSINMGSNERDMTSERTHTTNVTSIVKALVAPIQDLFKTTRKENTIENVRQIGNFGSSKINKQTVYDPNDIARTTIKETNIHNNRQGGMSGPNKLAIYDPDDIPRTTIKETNIHDVRTGNLGGYERGMVYDPNNVARTTIKETNIHNNHSGNLNNLPSGAVYDPDDVARTTIKEMNIHDNRQGNIGAFEKSTIYDPSDVTRTTIKETNIHNNHSGNLNNLPTSGAVYDPSDIARTTIKETNIHDTRQGHIGTFEKNIIYDPNDVARTTIKETNIHNNHSGNLNNLSTGAVYDPDDVAKTTIKETSVHLTRQGNMNGVERATVYDPTNITRTTMKQTTIYNKNNGNLGSNISKSTVYDPNDIAKTTIKETNIDDVRTGQIGTLEGKEGGYLNNPKNAPNTNRQFTTDEYTGTMDGNVNNNGGKGYLTNKKEAPNTNRQFTTTDYTGSADSSNSAPMSYDDIYSMTINMVKEGTLVGRNPTPSNTSMSVGGSQINQESTKIEEDIINNRDPNKTKIYNTLQELESCSITNEKIEPNNNKLIQRIEPSTLNAFNGNPYTKPLDSFAFN